MRVSEEVILELSDNEGICTSCGEIAYGVEPDAEDYECDGCLTTTVQGKGTLILGYL